MNWLLLLFSFLGSRVTSESSTNISVKIWLNVFVLNKILAHFAVMGISLCELF